MAKSLTDIEGIGPAKKKLLGKAGIRSVQGLLKSCCDKKGRKGVASASGIDEKVLLRYANMADLFRIKGVAGQYAELLEATGVDTVKELRNRNADNLHEAMHKANAKGKKRICKQPPSLSQVKRFVAHAKKLKPTITH